MEYKIVADSSCELPEEFAKDKRFERIAFGLEVGGQHLVDNEQLDIVNLLTMIAQSPTCPKSSCPSPQAFLDSFETEAERIYVVTISSKLSGSYNSAVLAKNMYEEKNSDKKIFVIDSESASCGESQIALRAMELEEQGKSFEEITKELEEYRDA
ncbi:MAG: DegV family protein, partial [Lachnospiraceae bacterium]|nr:DegV family protein [Lachnospiraceae bacterium]